MHNLILECNDLLKDGGFEYAFCGGHALDIHIGKVTRPHGDIDISAYREDRDKIISFMQSSGWIVYEAMGGGKVHLITDTDNQKMLKTNIFCVRKDCSFFHAEHIENNIYRCKIDCVEQTRLDFVEFLFNNRTADGFIYSRNGEIVRKLDKAVMYRDNIPYLSPELVLLYKSTDLKRKENKKDFDAVFSHLSSESKEWLHEALAAAYPKGHKWISLIKRRRKDMKKLDKYTPDKYLEKLYAGRAMPFDGVTERQGAERAIMRVREELLKCLNIGAIVGKKERLEVVDAESPKDMGDYVRRRVEVEICDGWHMKAYILTPKGNINNHPAASRHPSAEGNFPITGHYPPCRQGDIPPLARGARISILPGIVALSGHDYGCNAVAGLNKDGKKMLIKNYQKEFGVELVKRGNVVIVPELLAFGEAKLLKDEKLPFRMSSCYTVTMALQMYGITTAGMRVYQALRCLDILESLTGVDKDRLGMMGISGGGLVALFAGVLDERVKNTVVSGYVCTFKDSILAMHHCSDNYPSGLLNVGELYDIAACLAPRRLLIESGSNDRIFPRHGVETAVDKIREIYGVMGVSDNFDTDYFEGRHEVSGKKAYGFFE
jgi:hypothetical protein